MKFDKYPFRESRDVAFGRKDGDRQDMTMLIVFFFFFEILTNASKH